MRITTLLSAWTIGLGCIVAAAASDGPAPMPHVYMIGDSTMANKPVWPAQPERGWGQLLVLYFTHPEMIENHAMNGRSTKSFIDERRWEKVRTALKPGDWVIIQFGHNDEKKDKPAVYAEARGAFQENLRRFVQESRAAGAQPVLATPIARRRFGPSGELIDTHGDYPGAMRAVADEEKVPLLDLTKLSSEMLKKYGPERSKELFLWIPPGDYSSVPEGKQDDTHLSALGASRISELAVAELVRLQLPLMRWLKTEEAGAHTEDKRSPMPR
jgi:lysophospholipase L1-like esterase